MALSIKAPEADRLARAIAKATGESLTEVVLNALRERHLRTTGRPEPRDAITLIEEIQREVARLPVLDPRTPDEIIGYDEHGLPR